MVIGIRCTLAALFFLVLTLASKDLTRAESEDRNSSLLRLLGQRFRELNSAEQRGDNAAVIKIYASDVRIVVSDGSNPNGHTIHWRPQAIAGRKRHTKGKMPSKDASNTVLESVITKGDHAIVRGYRKTETPYIDEAGLLGFHNARYVMVAKSPVVQKWRNDNEHWRLEEIDCRGKTQISIVEHFKE